MSSPIGFARRNGRLRRQHLQSAVTEMLEPRRLLSAYSPSTLITFADGTEIEAGLTLFNGKLYGTTSSGGGSNVGTVFSVDPATNTVTPDIATFNGVNGQNPDGSFAVVGQNLFCVSDTTFASMQPGISEFNPATGKLSLVATFPTSTRDMNGQFPATFGGDMINIGGNLYGMAATGGEANGTGFLYECNVSTKTITPLVYFGPDAGGSSNDARLVDYNGSLYGMQEHGGTHNNGYIFQYNLSTKVLTTDYSFPGNPATTLPGSGLTNINGIFYGTTTYGGSHGIGALFSFNPANNSVTTLASFDGADGSGPWGTMTDIGGNLFGTCEVASADPGAVFEYNVSSHSLTAVDLFPGPTGRSPIGDLVDVNGTIYGTCVDSLTLPSNFQGGTVYALVPAQTLQLTSSLNNITLRVDPSFKNDVEVLNGSTKVEDISIDAPSLTITGGSSANTVTIDYKSGGFFKLPITFTGSGSSNTLSILDSTSGSPQWNVGSGKITVGNSGLTAAPMINFSGVQKVSLTGRSSGSETIAVQNTPHSGVTLPTMLTLNISSNDQVNVTGTASPLTVVGAGSSATNLDGVDIGSLAPNLGGTLTGILAPITVNNVSEVVADDSGDKTSRQGTLSTSSISGFGLPASVLISHTSINTLKVYGGTANNSDIVNSNSAKTTLYPGGGTSQVVVSGNAGPLTINGQGHTDNINIGAGTLALITSPITISSTGSASTLDIDAVSTTSAHSGTISSTSITGFSMGTAAAVNYTGSQLASLSVFGGSGANTDAITGTSAHTYLYPGTSAASTVNVKAASAPLTINGSGKVDFITIGSLAPSLGGTLTGITAPITVTNTSNQSTLTLDDSGDTIDRTGTLTPTTITGLGMASGAKVTYTGSGLHLLTLRGNKGGAKLTETGTSCPVSLINITQV